MALTLDGTNGITFPNATVQNNAVANNAAITALVLEDYPILLYHRVR